MTATGTLPPAGVKEGPLSSLDAALLHMETDTAPMHRAALSLFEGVALRDHAGRIRLEDIRLAVASRLPLMPQLTRMVDEGDADRAMPTWAPDPAFDLAHHVRLTQLPIPATEAALRGLCAELLATPLDRAHPLWDLTVVDGLRGGGIAVIERIHHSMAGALTAGELSSVLLSLTPDPNSQWPGRTEDRPPSRQAFRASLGALQSLRAGSVRVASAGGSFLRHPVRRAKERTRLGRAIHALGHPSATSVETPSNTPITSARAVHLLRLPFYRVQQLAGARGVTVNDVLLTLVAGGLHDLVQGRGELSPHSELRALVPLDLVADPASTDRAEVSAVFVRLPIGLDDPLDVLNAVSAEVREDVRRQRELAASALMELVEPPPHKVLATGAGIVHRQPIFNLVVTNTKGSTETLYADGDRLDEVFPIVPIAGSLSLGVAVMTYRDGFNVGVVCNPLTCPDVALFCDGMLSTLDTLAALADRLPEPAALAHSR